MALTVVVVAVCAFLCVASGIPVNRDPGMTVYCTEACLAKWHMDAVFGEELRAKLRNAQVPDISGNVSSILWSHFEYYLQNITLKHYEQPEVQMSITREHGIMMTVKVPEMTFEGNFTLNYYIGNCHQYYGMGNFSVLIRETSVRMLRKTILVSDLETIKYESFDGVCSVKDIDIVFDDESSNALLALIGDRDLKLFVEAELCKSYKFLTETTFNASYNFTPNIYLDKTFLHEPIVHDGYIESPHIGKVCETTDDEAFEPLPLPMELINPKRMKVYCMSDYLFNSFGSIVHKRKLLSYTYTKSDLPEECASLLNTSCESDCIGTNFPALGNDHPNSIVELNVSTAELPRVQITKDEFRVHFTLDMAAYARRENGDITLLFVIRLVLSARVDFVIRNNRIYLKMQHPDSNIEIIQSTIGELNEEKLLPLVELSLQKGLVPACAYFNQIGFNLGVPYPFSAARIEMELNEGYVCLMYDYLNKAN